MLRVAKAGGSIEINDAPRGAKLATGGGAIRIDNAGGPVSITTGGGGIRVGVARDSVSAATGGGDIQIRSADGPVDATSGSGDISVTLTGSRDVRIATGNGNVELRVPAGSDSGRKMRLRGRGWPGKTAGDQIVTLAIHAPKPETDAQREGYEALAKTFADYDPRA